ncbi:MAG TPA: DNA polymerase III subunit delta [Dehalococcoidia bacterium]
MIHLIYGADEYRVHNALRDLREQFRASVGDTMSESNTTVLDGRSLTPLELLSHVTAMPFLAESRLVIVEGLLGAIGAGVRGGRRKKPSPDDPLEPWRQAAEQLSDPQTMPETTTLVFVEGDLKSGNAAFTIFAPIAKTLELGAMTRGEVPAWIAEAADIKGVRLAPRAIAALSQIIGPDLFMLDRELDKLDAYADGELVEAETVAEVVSAFGETKIWGFIDAIVAGNEPKALEQMLKVLADGSAPTQLTYMIARQYRQLIIVKDMRERRARQDEVARAAGIVPFRLNAVGAIASRYSWPMLRAAYAKLVDADLSVKRGLRDDETALQLLVHELCALAPPVTSGYSR